MTQIAHPRRLATTIRARLVERGLLLAEQSILSVLLQKAAQSGDETVNAGIDWGQIRERHGLNSLRLAELEGRTINKIVFALRDVLLGCPKWIERPMRRGLRAMTGSAPSALEREGAGQPKMPTLAVPFGAEFPQPSLSVPIGVVMHVFYPELAAEMRAYLENIPGPVDLYISTDTAGKQARLEHTFSGWTAGTVNIRVSPNRGRDIAPKLVTFRDVYDRHPIVLHLHSKKSPHESLLRMWRHFIFENLMVDQRAVAGILSAFECNPSIGMISADHYFPVRGGISWGDNLPLCQMLGRRMGAPIDPQAPLDFPTGSMFWARSAALKPLLDLNLTMDDFGAEESQTDGTLAHALERLYFYTCEVAGYRWIKICRPELAGESGAALKRIHTEPDLTVFLEQTTTSLLIDPLRAAGLSPRDAS